MQELRRIAQETERANRVADSAMAEIGTHERECALRYEGIIAGLKPIPDLFGMISRMNKVLYTGVGIMITVPMVFGIILTIKQLVLR